MRRYQQGLVIDRISQARAALDCLDYVATSYDNELITKQVARLSRFVGSRIDTYVDAEDHDAEFSIKLVGDTSSILLGTVLQIASERHPEGDVRDTAAVLAKEYGQYMFERSMGEAA